MFFENVWLEFLPDKKSLYRISLVVSDGELASQPDEVAVNVLNRPPVARAGMDQDVSVGDSVALDGSFSSDEDGDELSYAWSFVQRPEGSQTAFDDASSVRPRFVADMEGEYQIGLVVNDGEVDSQPDIVVVRATVVVEENHPPVANAGPDKSVKPNRTVNLDGGGSSDSDGDALTYSWRIISKPLRSTPKLVGVNQQIATFSSSKSGKYVIGLKVYDGKVWSSEDRVTVIVSIRAVDGSWLAGEVLQVHEAIPNGRQARVGVGNLWAAFVAAADDLRNIFNVAEVEAAPGRKSPQLLWKDATSYHKTDWFEQQEAKDDFALANSPGSPYAQAVEKMRADAELVKLPTRTETAGEKQSATASTPRLISHGLYYHFTDHLGSSNIVTDEAGNIVEASDYYPYGKARVQEKTDPAFSNKKQFTGKEKDASGLTYFGARYYDERVGRFTQADKIATFFVFSQILENPRFIEDKILKNPQILNIYSYVQNNPLRYTDPTGDWFKEWANGFAEGFIFFFKAAIVQLYQTVSHPIIAIKEMIKNIPNFGSDFKNLVNYHIDKLVELGAIDDYTSGEAAGLLIAEIFTFYVGVKAIKIGNRKVLMSKKISSSLEKRGWTEESIKNTIENPNSTKAVRDTRRFKDGTTYDDPATQYYDEDGHYVVVNDKTGEIVQISDKTDPDWVDPNK